MIPLFTVYRSAKRRRSRRSAANSSNVSNQPLRRTRTCPPGYPHHTLSNVTAHRNRPAPPRACDRRNRRTASHRPCGIIGARPSTTPTSHRARRMAIAFFRSSNACVRSGRRPGVGLHRHDTIARDAQPPTAVALDRCLAVPLAFIRVQPHSDTMHPLTSALAKSRPQFDSRPQACVHPSVLPPPVAPPLVCAAPPPSAARAG